MKIIVYDIMDYKLNPNNNIIAGGKEIYSLLKNITNLDISMIIDRDTFPNEYFIPKLMRRKTLKFIKKYNKNKNILVIACNTATSTVLNKILQNPNIYEPITPVCDYILANNLQNILIVGTVITCKLTRSVDASRQKFMKNI